MIRDGRAAVASAEALLATARAATGPVAPRPTRAVVRMASSSDPARLFVSAPAQRRRGVFVALAVLAATISYGVLHR